MAIQSTRWSIPLNFKPQLFQAARSVQEQRPRQGHRLADLWSLNLFRSEATVQVDQQVLNVRAGYCVVTPPNAWIHFRFSSSCSHSYAHFQLPELRTDAVPIPAVQDLGEAFEGINRRLDEAIACFPTQPRRAEVRVWDLLWELATSGDKTEAHPAIERARQLIELRLAESISVANLAREMGLSHNHLTRLFHAATGMTVAGYIRDRRVKRARHLLTHTSAPVKTVAAEVGIPDLHLFNKTIRAFLGTSPRGVRGKSS